MEISIPTPVSFASFPVFYTKSQGYLEQTLTFVYVLFA
jgi:hypothetical protein